MTFFFCNKQWGIVVKEWKQPMHAHVFIKCNAVIKPAGLEWKVLDKTMIPAKSYFIYYGITVILICNCTTSLWAWHFKWDKVVTNFEKSLSVNFHNWSDIEWSNCENEAAIDFYFLSNNTPIEQNSIFLAISSKKKIKKKQKKDREDWLQYSSITQTLMIPELQLYTLWMNRLI